MWQIEYAAVVEVKASEAESVVRDFRYVFHIYVMYCHYNMYIIIAIGFGVIRYSIFAVIIE